MTRAHTLAMKAFYSGQATDPVIAAFANYRGWNWPSGGGTISASDLVDYCEAMDEPEIAALEDACFRHREQVEALGL
jgi:gamma-glutamyltranspeptidase